MDAPEQQPKESWLRRRGVDLVVWPLTILAMLAIAAGAAWYLSTLRVEPSKTPLPYEEPARQGSMEGEPASSLPAPPVPVPPPARPAPDVPGATGPRWLVQPAPSFPSQATTRRQAEGEVRLTCVAESTGRLSQCRIIREAPEGYGFGANAVQAAEQARVTPRKIDGVAVRSEITFNVRYRLAP